jgi:methylmalonyl-CoA mutase
MQGWIDNDPLGALARQGSLPAPLETHLDEMAWLAGWAAARAPGFGTIAVHGDYYQNSGGHAVQELAFALATGVAYIRAMQARGLDIETSAPRMGFVLGVGPDFFMEMAKLRAARLLWAQVVDAFGGARAQRMRIHARTASWNKAAADPHVNLLRTTTEAFAGALGGAESLHVTPFDAPLHAPDEFSRRLARNQQLILQAEANLTRLIDPAGGAWYVEWLTDQVARRAWSLFQEVESQGGMAAALTAGFPQAQVAATAKARAANMVAGKDIFVGVNRYPPPADAITPVHHAPASTEEASSSPGEGKRTQVDENQRRALLGRLAQARQTGGPDVVQAAVAAAAGGVTLGELTAALRAGAGDGPAVTPLAAFHMEEALP